MNAGAVLVQIVLGIARLGYRGAVSEQCLSSLVAHAQDNGVAEVLGWIQKDPGYLSCPSWQFLPCLPAGRFPGKLGPPHGPTENP